MKSPVFQLLSTVWNNAKRESSYREINKSMIESVCIAIRLGFKFEPQDFKDIKRYHIYSWRDGDGGQEWWAEEFYKLAVKKRNISACISFEAWKDRKPFLFNDITCKPDVKRKKKRLALGSEFHWDCIGKKSAIVEVTNINRDRIIACQYAEIEESDYHRKIQKRYTITRENLKNEMSVRKELVEKMK